MIKAFAAAVSALCFAGVQAVDDGVAYSCTIPVLPKPTPHTVTVPIKHVDLSCGCQVNGKVVVVQVNVHNNVHVNIHNNTHNVTQIHNNIHPNIHNKTKK